MSEQKINPGQVTKPIQLLAAWLVGLILTNGAFLSAANVISKPDWAPGLLVIASVINVPAFLFLIFYLQTKFRAELQEDTYYSKHLEAITGQVKHVSSSESGVYSELKNIQIASNIKFDLMVERFESLLIEVRAGNGKSGVSSDVVSEIPSVNVLESKDKEKSLVQVGLNDLVPDFKQIAKALISSGFDVDEYFGSSGNNQPPKNLTISYGEKVSKESLKAIYIILKPFGFNFIDFDIDPYRPKPSSIWVGSYIDPYDTFGGRASIRIDEEIESRLLDDEFPISSFSEIVRAGSRRR